jgi:glutathione synthase/RimK-type ligase-like ATP-grasp enzyme
MLNWIKEKNLFKSLSKNAWYLRLRVFFPYTPYVITDDRKILDEGVETVVLEWPASVRKPMIGLIQDPGPSPRWTKYRRFFENNSIPYEYYDLAASDWLTKAGRYDVIVGVEASVPFYLEQIRRKFFTLERHLGKKCFPTYSDMVIYEDKILETYISEIHHFPFLKTYIYNSKEEALADSECHRYPLVNKIVPCSGSVGVELVKTPHQYRRIVQQSFSPGGRKSHVAYQSQKNFVYFQEYVPNDGYDIRIITIADSIFGYYRKAPKGDFRASGMGLVEKRELPPEAIKIAREVNDVLKCSMLVVDLLRGSDGRYYIIELSPMCRIDTAEQLHVDGKPGVYVAQKDGTYSFKPGRYWVHELALKDFFEKIYLHDVMK